MDSKDIIKLIFILTGIIIGIPAILFGIPLIYFMIIFFVYGVAL